MAASLNFHEFASDGIQFHRLSTPAGWFGPELLEANASDNQTVTLTGRASTLTIGTLKVNRAINLTGRASTLTIGALQVRPVQFISLTGRASTLTFGTLKVNQKIVLVGVPSTFGAPYTYQHIYAIATDLAGTWTAQPSGTLHGNVSDHNDSTYDQLLEADSGSTMVLTLDTLQAPAAGDGYITFRSRSI